MDEKTKKDDKKVLLVQEAGDGKLKLKGVTKIDKKGNAKTTPDYVSESNLASLLNVNTHDSALEAFFKKMVEQAQNPAHTGFSKIFIMAESVLEKLIKTDFDPQELEKYRVDPAAELQKMQDKDSNVKQEVGDASQSFQPMDVSKIDLTDLERKGIRMENLEPHLKAMSYGYKSSKMIDMNPEMEPGGARVPTQGRVSLEQQPDGSLLVIPHYRQEKPNLDGPVYGTLLDSEEKANLLATGNAGKIVNLELTPGNKVPCYLTLDPMTNRLEAMLVSELGKVERIKGVELTSGQQMDFLAGKKITVEKMLSRSGYYFDGHVQINASDKNFKFTYEGLDRNRYAEENKGIRRHQRETNGYEPQKNAGAEDREKRLYIYKRILGAEVPEEALKNWTEAANDPSKRQDVKAFYIRNMKKEGQDEPFKAWVKPNFEKVKFDFFKYNPKYAKKQDAGVKPADESRQRQYQTPPAKRYSPPKLGVKQGGVKI